MTKKKTKGKPVFGQMLNLPIRFVERPIRMSKGIAGLALDQFVGSDLSEVYASERELMHHFDTELHQPYRRFEDAPRLDPAFA